MRLKQLYRYGCWALSFQLWALVLSAQDPPGEREIVEEIIEKYIASQGGREILKTLRSVELEGEIVLKSQGIIVGMRQKVEAPDKLFMVQGISGIGQVRQVLNGDRGWEWHPVTGQRSLVEREVREFLREVDLQRDLRLFELYDHIGLDEPVEIEGHMTQHLIFSDKECNEEHWYFKDNGDLFQLVRTVPVGPQGELLTRQRFYEFKTVQGFRLPMVTHLHNPAFQAEATISRCLINQEFDPAIFEIP